MNTDGLALATRGPRKSYGTHLAFAGLGLSVPRGTVYGFLGPNGAGIRLDFASTFATVFLPDIVKYLPFNVATAAVATGTAQGAGFGAGSPGAALDPNAALLLIVIWLVGALAVAALFTERAEIGG